MMNKSYETIVETIVKKASISKWELESRIEKKIKELDGFITKEGAAHIVALELKVKLFDENQKTNIQIKDLVPGMISATVVGKLLQKYEMREFERNGRRGAVLPCLVGDETGRVRVVFWDLSLIKKVESELSEGDVILVKNVRIRENSGFVEVHAGAEAAIKINPEGYYIGTVLGGSLAPDRSYNVSDIEHADNPGLYEFTGQILQIFEPKRFLACSECSKKVDESGKCRDHPGADSTERVILNFFLDDGTSNIRCSMFSSESESFIDLNNFEEEKGKTLFGWFTVKGRTNTNNVSGRPEIIVNSIEHVDVKERVKKLVEN